MRKERYNLSKKSTAFYANAKRHRAGEMRAAVIKYGYAQEHYGEAFWTSLIDGYAAAAHNARHQDCTTSGATGYLKKLADEVWLMHKAIS